MNSTEFKNDIKKCCFTGYRPNKLPFDINIKDRTCNDFENLITKGILKLADESCLVFYSGMAMGFDIMCAEAVLMLKKVYNKPLKLICAIPYPEQCETFYDKWKQRYFNILNSCDEKLIISPKYYKGCYQKRNKFMVDNSDYVLTWFNGKAGGTKNTVNYAIKKNKFVLNLNQKSSESYYPQTIFEII